MLAKLLEYWFMGQIGNIFSVVKGRIDTIAFVGALSMARFSGEYSYEGFTVLDEN